MKRYRLVFLIKGNLFFLFAVSLVFPYTDADVTITTEENPFECGSSITLTCIADDITVSWMNENDITPIAKCTRISCDLNPHYKGVYEFSSDVDQRVFNLTIRKVTAKDNRRKFICSDGDNNDFRIIEVRDYKALLFEDPENGLINATSGCISMGKRILFKWIKINASNKHESEFFPKALHIYATSCSNSECGNYYQINLTETISVERSGNMQYYLKVVVIYGNKSIESHSTSKTYTIGEHDDGTEDGSECQCRCVSISLYALCAGFSIAVVLKLISKERIKKEE